MPYDVLDVANAEAAPVVTLGDPLTSEGETLLSLITELDLMLGSRDDFDATRQKKAVNDAYRQMSASLNLALLYGSFALTTIDGSNLYLLPSCVAWIKRVALSDTTDFVIEGGRALLKIDLAKYRELPVPFETSDLFPRTWFKFGKMLVLYPTPDDAYDLAVDIKIQPNDLVDNTDSPILPIELHEPLLLKARANALRALRMWREARAAQNDYVDAVRPLLDTDAEERESEQAHMSPARSVRMLYRGKDF